MTYTYHTLQDWNGNNAQWPSQVYTESNESGFEIRKLIIHAQGGISFASEGMQQGACYLESAASNPFREPLFEGANSVVTLISQTEFEDTWETLVLQSR